MSESAGGEMVRPVLAQSVSGGTEADADGGHQGVAVAGADRLFRYLLFSAGDIADDLCQRPPWGRSGR